jgi:hypothetical protein
MPESVLAKKMKRKPEARAAILKAPAGYEAAAFAGMPPAAGSLTGTFDWIQMFVRNEAELKKLAPGAARALKPDGMLWISFPKGSSKTQTDLTRDKGWDSLDKLDLRRITLISINETWSAFAFRPNTGGQKRTRARN